MNDDTGTDPEFPIYVDTTEAADGQRARAAAVQAAATIAAGFVQAQVAAGIAANRPFAMTSDESVGVVWGMARKFEQYVLTGEGPDYTTGD